MRLRLIYPRFQKFLEGHRELDELVRTHLVGNYTMPPSLALPIIAAITPPGIDIALTDDNSGQPIDFDEKPDAVCISCFTPQASRAYEIADAFRSRGTTVIMGGIHPTGAPQEAAQHADAVCVGEVEPVWADILRDLTNGALKKIYRPAEPYDLALMPNPLREIFPRDRYQWDAHLVLTSRGCFVKCAGCPIPDKEGVMIRTRPVANVIADIRSMPYREFYFTDDTLMLPGKKSKKFILSIMERTAELNVSIFLASTMMMEADVEFYRALRRGGATSIYTIFGFDRMSKLLLSPSCPAADWQKGVDLVRMIEDAGIHFFGSFGLGFDDQDDGVADRILRFCDDARIDLAEFYILTPFPGTPFGRQAEREDRILHRNYTLWNHGNVVFKPSVLTEKQILDDFYRLWKEFYNNKSPVSTLRSFKEINHSPAVR